MKTQIYLTIITSVIAICGTGCSHDPVRPQTARISENTAAFAALPSETQQRIRQGFIENGYTPEMVYMALGKPDSIVTSADGAETRWTYRKFYPSTEVDNTSFNPIPVISDEALFAKPRSAVTKGGSAGRGFPEVTSNPDTRGAAKRAAFSNGGPVITNRGVTLEILFQDNRVSGCETLP